ncbi:histidine kinase [Lysobacter arenosi]|uniref:histidine kinase n=1 Tax=Lysobacter arenosi TaxID=2795387 RepID=A0ABX7RC07_9GAMM|nr:ATP-binding protein [Lysobacter arenosi]QSX74502.1 histidine kinase [Lysobacter arenosi]
MHWLSDVPIDDPVDRRNAPVMQALFLFLGITVPAMWAFHIAYAGMPRGGLISLATSLVIATVQLACVALIRRGRFGLAVRLGLAAVLAGMVVETLDAGFREMSSRGDVEPFMVLAIAGLMLGRRALWAIFASLQVINASGFVVDLLRTEQVDASFANLLTAVAMQFVIAVIIDRAANALRETMAESDQRGRNLQLEMQAREKAQTRLIHAQKLEATGRLASGIAHDFGNILSLIRGYAGQRDRILDIERRDLQEAAIAKALDGIDTAAERGTAITRKLLSFSRHDLARVKVFDAAQAVVGMRPMLRQLFPASVRVELPDNLHAHPVRVDRSEFELMVINIAANARDAMPDGGTFRVDLATDASGGTRLLLSDTGHGMDAQTREKIFDPFFSTKTDSGGTGLGLAVIHDMILASGGEISVESVPGQGSVFHIRLPEVEPDSGSPEG